MKSSVTISRQGPRELTTARKVAATIVVLCLLVGSVVFFQSNSNSSSDITISSPQTIRPAIGQSADEAAAPAVTDASPTRSALAGAYQSPSLISSAGVDPSATTEIVLPAPPSGDYELNLTAEQISALIDKRYGGLFQRLELPPEQVARLRSLLAERQQATVDAANAALLNGLNPIRDLVTIRSAIAEAQAAIDTTLRNELGESVLAACSDSDRTLGERNAVGDFARLLATTHTPLRPEQEKQVLQILKNSPARDLPMDIDRAIFGGINTRARISDRAIAEAATVLSSSQLELLRQLQQHWAVEGTRR